MERKELVIGTPVAVAGITLIPIENVSLNHLQGKKGISFFAAKRPVNVIAVSASATTAFRITGEEVTLEQLEREVPGINVILEGISSSSE